MKSTWYAQPHDMINRFGMTLEPSAVAHKNSLDIPLLQYDEALGDPSSVNTHPEHASFTSSNKANCYSDSTIGQFWSQLTINATHDGSVKVMPIKFGVQILSPAFLEDLNPIDQITGLDIETVLSLQHEITNRNTYSVYSGLDCPIPFTGSSTLSGALGLTTDQKMETTDFDIEQFYDMLQYGGTSKKLMSVQSGIKWYTMIPRAENRSEYKINIHLKSSVKRMNEYAALIARVIVPPIDNYYQVGTALERTADEIHLNIDAKTRFNEWNEFFDFSRT